MVSKCANPACNATFLYFHNGQLFRFETSASGTGPGTYDANEMKKPMRRLEFFWLCDNCARNMTVAFDKGRGISVQPKFVHAASAA